MLPGPTHARTALAFRTLVVWAAVVAHAATAVGVPVAVAGKRACDGRCGCGAVQHTDCCCTAPKAARPKPVVSCCQPAKSCCSTKPAAGGKAGKAPCCSAPKPEAEPTAEPAFAWLPAWKLRVCHGETPSGLPPAPASVCPPVEPVPVERPEFAFAPAGDALPVARPAVPPVPPPKPGRVA